MQSVNHVINIHYQYFIQSAKEEIKQKHYMKADYYLYLALLSPNINIVPYISVISLRSFIYFELNDCRMLLYLSSKLLKLFPLIIEQINDIKPINDIIVVLSRTGIALYNNPNEYNIMLPFYFLSISKRLIKRKQVSIEDKNYKDFFDNHYENIKVKLQKGLNYIKQAYYDVLTLNGEEFIKEEKETLYTVIDELKEESNYDKAIDNNNDKEYYVVSNKWLDRYKSFLLNLNNFKNSPNKYNRFLNMGFETTLQYFNFIEEDYKRYDCPYINSINNFWVEQFKDSWIVTKAREQEENEEDYTDAFLKSFISKSEYSLLNKTQWEKLAKNFGFINEIKRYKLMNGEIEIHLKRIKVMVLNKDFNKDDFNILKPKTIQLSKEKTINDLIGKINRCLIDPNSINNNAYNIYKVNLSSMSLFDKKQLIFEIMISYYHSNSSISLKCENLIQTNKSIESLEDKCLIIIEQLSSISNGLPLIREIDCDKGKCSYSLCNNTQSLVKCSKCKVNLINTYWYCSKECEIKDIDHLSYHNYLSKYIILKTSMNDLNKISFKSIISKDPKTKQGKVILRSNMNLSFTYMNSIIMLIAHCKELNKYFLTERYIDEINNASNYKKVLIEYVQLLKLIWNGTESVVNADGLIKCLNKAGYDNKTNDSPYAFMLFLLNILHATVNRGISRPNINKGKFALNNKTDIEISNYYWRLFKEKEDSLIIDLFHGQLKNKTTCCYCKDSINTYTIFNSLSIDIPSILHKLQFLFFPLVNTEEKEMHLVYHQYKVTISKIIKASDLLNAVIANNPHLTIETLEVDYILVKPNKQFDHLITISKNGNDNISYLFDDLSNGYQLLLYQRTKSLRNIYVYPCDFITRYKLFLIPYIDIAYLSYPFALQMPNDSKVNDFYVLIKKVLKRLFDLSHIKQSSYKQFLYENEKFIAQDNDLFRLFIYNANQEEDIDDYVEDKGREWDYYIHINNRKNKNSTICDVCGQHCLYCSFSNRFNQNESFEYIFSLCNKDKPFVLYAQLLSMDKQATLFNNNDNDYHGDTSFSSIEVKKNISLNDCLNIYFDNKIINDNEQQCSKCHKTSGQLKKMDISIPPFYLIVHLNDINTVEFPVKGLDMSNHIIRSFKAKPIYDLYSSIVFDSSMNHYLICRYFTKFLYVSNTTIELRDNFIINKSNSSSTNILLYKRRQKD